MVGELFQITLNVSRRKRATTTGEDRVNVIPRQQGTVHATADTCFVAALLKHGGHAREGPRLGVAQVYVALRVLEIVDIRGIILCATGRTRNKLSKLARKRDMRGFFYVQEGNLVKH